MSDKTFLTGAYDLKGPDETRAFYDDWSASYDAEIHKNGYVTPQRCAKALASYSTDKTAPHLDIGCGTGVSGEALTAAGFTNLHGTDLSAEMIAQAKQKDIYQSLTVGDLTDPFPFEQGTYASMSAVGVLSPGHAPASTLTPIVDRLAPGGLFTFSLNDHALDNSEFMPQIRAILKQPHIETLFQEHGDHLPGINLRSTVYVLRRLE